MAFVPTAQRLPQYLPKTTTISVPAPSGGWNARDSLDAMDPGDAISLINMFPTFGKVSRRNGYVSFATGLGGAVKTLSEYNAATTRKLLAAANGKIFNVSSGGAVGAALASGFTSDAWQTAMFQNAAGVANQIWVNGADAPQIFDGSTITGATISGTNLTTTTLVGAIPFKNRVFYWQNSSQILWYSAIGAIAGSLTAFNLGGLSGFGGNIQALATWTRDGGSGPEDYLVVLMTSGDVIMYSGSDISDAANWAIVGIFHIGSPVGARCAAKLGPDLAVINKDGFVPLSQVMPGLWNPAEALSNKITFAAQQAVQSYHDNFGWQMLLYPLGNMAIFNIPISTSVFNQYVMNTATGAWSQFTNLNAVCWSLFEDDPYFGGADGNIYLFSGSSANPIIGTDNGGPIAFSAQTAWNYFGDRSRLKRMCMVRPAFASDSSSVSLGLSLGTDFNNPMVPSVAPFASPSGTPWNSSPWGSPWSPSSTTFLPRAALSGVGNAFSLAMSGNISSANFDWYSNTYQYEPGNGV